MDAEFFPKTLWQSAGSNEIIGEIVKEASDEVVKDLQSLLTGKAGENRIFTLDKNSVKLWEVLKGVSDVRIKVKMQAK